MVSLKNMTKYDKLVRKLGKAKVIEYQGKFGPEYLIINQVIGGIVHGEIAQPIGVNAVSIDDLLEKEVVIFVPEKK